MRDTAILRFQDLFFLWTNLCESRRRWLVSHDIAGFIRCLHLCPHTGTIGGENPAILDVVFTAWFLKVDEENLGTKKR